jgi:hypothetical protein
VLDSEEARLRRGLPVADAVSSLCDSGAAQFLARACARFLSLDCDRTHAT